MQAAGSFTVTMTPEAEGRMRVAKVFGGGFVGTGEGTMLVAMTAREGSAAYVLIERLEGTLDGVEGSFSLAHLGLMDRGVPDQRVAIVPDSGAGGLAGIKGHLTMEVGGGRHDYVLHYALAGN